MVDEEEVLGNSCYHYPSALEVRKSRPFHIDIRVYAQNAGRVRMISRISFQLAVEHVEAGAGHTGDAGNLFVGLFKNSVQ